MKKIPLFIITMAIAASCNTKKGNNEMALEYPSTKKVDTVDVYFGDEVPDPYRWLEDDRSEETAAWVKTQNEVTFGYLEQIPFREQF